MREDDDENNSYQEQQQQQQQIKRGDGKASLTETVHVEKENPQEQQTIIETPEVFDQYMDVHPPQEETASALERETQTSEVNIEQQHDSWGDDELDDTILINDDDDGYVMPKEELPKEMHAQYVEEENGVLVVDVSEEAQLKQTQDILPVEDAGSEHENPPLLYHDENICSDENIRISTKDEELLHMTPWNEEEPNLEIEETMKLEHEEESDEKNIIAVVREENEEGDSKSKKEIKEYEEKAEHELTSSKEDKEKDDKCTALTEGEEEENDETMSEHSYDNEPFYSSIDADVTSLLDKTAVESLSANNAPAVGFNQKLRDEKYSELSVEEHNTIGSITPSFTLTQPDTAADNSDYTSETVDDTLIGGIFSSFLKNSLFNPDNDVDNNTDDANTGSTIVKKETEASTKASENEEKDINSLSIMPEESQQTAVENYGTDTSCKNDRVIVETMLPDLSSQKGFYPSPNQNDNENNYNEHVVQKLMEQMQLLEQHHSSELAELARKHEKKIDELNSQLKERRHAASGYQLEQQFRLQAQNLQEKCEQLQSHIRNQEQQILILSEKNSSILIEKEETIHTLKNNLTSSNKKVLELETLLQEEEHKVKTTTEQYDSLKTRVKSVAQELKERRIECRSLSSQLEEVKASNMTLKHDVERLQKELTTKVQAAEDISTKELLYQSSRKIMEEKIAKLENDVLEERRKGEQALLTYKNKSVKALADAQRRVAAANQVNADSEAELIVLRANLDDMQSMLDQMNERVEDRIKDYKENNQQLLEKISDKEMMIAQVERELASQREIGQRLAQQKAECEKDLAQTRAEWEHIQCLYQKEAELNRELAKSNAQLETDLKQLKDELNMAKDENDDLIGGSKRMADKKVSSSSETGLESADNTVGNFHLRRRDDMVSLLQEDLLEANRAIEGLKEALRQALAQNKQQITKESEQRRPFDEDGDNYYDNYTVEDSYTDIPLGTNQEVSNNGGTNTALFYAFEKQAELNTARDEINRLANLIGEVQCEKQEALDEMNKLQKKLEETEAKLSRQCKLLVAPAIGLNNSTISKIPSGTKSNKAAAIVAADEAANAASANIEYLKHVMLRYLRARTTNEKRALLPVIAAVLCLTSDEKRSVERAVEESGGLSGMGNAFLESLETLAATAHSSNRA